LDVWECCGLAQESEKGRKQLGGALNIRHVAAVIQHQQIRAECLRNLLRGGEGNGILSAMNDECRYPHVTQRGQQVEVAE
jgi:hypothetical protein